MATPRFRHRVEYTANKHSRAVVRGETIVIRLARGLSATEQEQHIRSLLRRMTHLLLREGQKTVIDPFRPLLRGESACTIQLASGRSYVLALVPGNRTRARRTREGWQLTVGPRVRRDALHRFLWSLVAQAETADIERLVATTNHATLRVPIRAVRLRFMRSQWGSCSVHGVITLNAALLFLSPSALEYVIVHELAHRRIASHAPAFWRSVASVLPAFERPYRLLQQHRLPQA